MRTNVKRNWAVASILALVGCGRTGSTLPPPGPVLPDAVLRWNAVALNAVVVDHTPVLVQLPNSGVPGANSGSQRGPNRTSRALAIIHAAMYDALNSIVQSNEPYLYTDVAPATASIEAAVAQAGHDTCVASWPAQIASFDQALADDLAAIPDGASESDGIAVGAMAAAAILADRASDGSAAEYPGNTAYTAGTLPGRHRPDPINPGQGFLTPTWGFVRPFAIPSVLPFQPAPPPALNSPEYTAAFNEVKSLGSDGVSFPTTRTALQTEIGTFWAYDGTAGLGVPPRLFNQVTRTLSLQEGLTQIENARLFALVNFALADAAIACWYRKFTDNCWRPILGIRESDVGTGPSGLGDGNAATAGLTTWVPLGAPSSNTDANNFTPNFPSYTGGHPTFGGALFQTLRRFFGTDAVSFTFTSDEFNGVTRENSAGSPRPLTPHSFSNFSAAEQENADSRIYLGIHWRFDETQGVLAGRGVANEIFDTMLQPK